MKIRQITARAGRTLPHPTHQYGNLQTSLEAVADLDDGEDFDAAAAALQSDLENKIERHAAELVGAIEAFEETQRQTQLIARLKRELNDRNAQLAALMDRTENQANLFDKTANDEELDP